MRPRSILPAVLATFALTWLPAAPPAAAAPPQALTVYVDMHPTGGAGADATPPGVTNNAGCNAALGSPDTQTGSQGWEQSDQDRVNSNNLVCATVLDSKGQPLFGETVTLTSSGPGLITDENGPDPSLSTDESVIGKDGFAWFYVFSTRSGTQSLTASYGPASRATTQVWDAPGAAQARVVGCTPDQASVEAGAQQDVACTVTDGLGNPVAGVPVSWSLRDTDGASSSFVSKSDATDAQGAAHAVVTSSSSGVTHVHAALDQAATECAATANGPDPYDQGKPAGVCADAAVLTWSAPSASGLSLNPTSLTAPQFTQATFTATAHDGNGAPAPGVTIQFVVSGANRRSRAEVTDDRGQALYHYVGRIPGEDTLTAFADANGNGELDSGEAQAQATITWTESCPHMQNDPREQIVGTDRDDTLRGTVGFDIICGLGGNDVLRGRGGGDLLLGGNGRDRLIGGADNDVARGGPGYDRIFGGVGMDELEGGSGNDYVEGGDQADRLFGDSGRDRLLGGPGGDDLEGGSGKDFLDGGPEVDYCRELTDKRTRCER